MTENGEEKVEKLRAVAWQIANSLGQNDPMAHDILQILSNYDGRFHETLSERLGVGEDARGYTALEQTLKSLESQISPYLSADHPIWPDSSDASTFLDAVDEVVTVISHWTPMAAKKPVGACLDRAEYLLQQAMLRLEDEFRSLIERGGESFDMIQYRDGESAATANYLLDSDEEDGDIPVAHPISDYNIVIDALPSGTINDLHEIAKRMVATGYGKECSHTYSICRREFLEESLSRLGLQKLSSDEVQKMPWTDLEDEIERWIKAVKVSLCILFPSERRLCDRIFFGFDSAADLSFMEVCRFSTIQLLNFAGAVAIGSRAPERLFRVMDIFETTRDLMPEFDVVFSDEYGLFLRNEAITIWKRLGEAIRGIFMELEFLIDRDPAKSVFPGGGLHPITRYVMNYLLAACRSEKTLEQVFEERAVSPHGGDYSSRPDGRPLSSSFSLSVQMTWIMELLESNLEAKSKFYRDSALCHFFMMNNGRYIVEKVQDTELESLLGYDWIRNHTSKVQQYQANYQKSSWSKVLGVLKLESSSSAPNVGAKALREKIKLFNVYFEEICKTQSTWIIFDEQLREELRIWFADNLLPAYHNFLGRLLSVPDFVNPTDSLVKYSVEDVEARISELFRGRGGPSAGG